MNILTGIVIGIIVIATVGCDQQGHNMAAGMTSKHIDPCSLMSDKDAAGILGLPETQHFDINKKGTAECEWSTTSPVGVITLHVGGPGTALTGFVPGALTNASPEPVPGMGDTGYYVGLGTIDFSAAHRRNYVQVVWMGLGDGKAMRAKAAKLLQSRLEEAAK